MPDAEVRHYPLGHFDRYLGAVFEHISTGQLAFLRSHSGGRGHMAAAGHGTR